MKYLLTMCSVAAAAICAGSPASAAPVVFTDRALWQSAAGGTGNLFEDFNGFAADAFYHLLPVSAGFLNLSVVNGVGDTSWRIDATPATFATIPSVNGSTFAITATAEASAGFGGTRVAFGPVFALGFDYAGASYSNAPGVLTTSLGDTVVLAASDNLARSFVGVLYTGGETFSSLTWSSAGHFAAGIDSVEAFRTVPEPATTVLTGVGVLFGIRSSQRRGSGGGSRRTARS